MGQMRIEGRCLKGCTRAGARYVRAALGSAFLLLVAGTFAPLAAQLPPNNGAGTTVDSSEVVDRARDAQRRFERLRIRHLPWRWGGWGGPCDERVGRLCWHHDDPEDEWTRPAEVDALSQARDELVDTLASFHSRLSGDPWILGQLVWYLGEGGRWHEAAAVARACGTGDPRWCSALEGLALHETKAYVEAARAFDLAGDVVDEKGGDGNEAFRVLFDRSGRRLLDEPANHANSELQPDSLVWLLADPSYLVPGNDRRTEHAARRVVNRIRDGSRNPYSMPWGKDMSELVIRYGWAVAWERVRDSGSFGEPASIVGRHPSKGRRFVPSATTLESPTTADAEALAPVVNRPRTTYRPNYASVIRPAEAEVFGFDRGDSVVFIAAFTEQFTDSVSVAEGSFAANLATGSITAGRRVGAAAWSLVTVRAPYIVSVERLPETTLPADSAGEGRRFRRAFPAFERPTGVLALSEIMVLNEGAEPTTLDEAARELRAPSIAPGETVTVAWEAYGLGFDDAAIEYEVLVGRKREGILATVGDWIGVGDDDTGLLIDWVEPQPDDPGPQLRWVSVTFPELAEGSYALRIRLRMAGRSEVFQERELEVSLSR